MGRYALKQSCYNILYTKLGRYRCFIMADKKIVMTYEGMKKLQDELQDLKVVRRKDVAKKLQEAREQGDLSENAEYDAAKDEQRDIEARIDELEAILKNVEVVAGEDVDADKISIGCTVDGLDIEFDEQLEYKIVGSTDLQQRLRALRDLFQMNLLSAKLSWAQE